jgi:hypothetical protein
MCPKRLITYSLPAYAPAKFEILEMVRSGLIFRMETPNRRLFISAVHDAYPTVP